MSKEQGCTPHRSREGGCGMRYAVPIMLTRHTFNKTVWLDILNPTGEEIRAVFEECDLPHEFTNDLATMTPHTETRVAKNALKITLDFPVVKRADIDHPHEIKFLATKSHLITIRFDDMALIHQFKKEFEVLSILKQSGAKATGGHLFLALLAYLYDGLNMKLDYLESRMQDVENGMFTHDEKETLFEISQISQRLITFEQTLSAHHGPLHDLEDVIGGVFGKSYIPLAEKILVNYDHLIIRMRALTHTLSNLRDTDNALLSAKQNEIMKTLTVMAFIMLPLTLMSSLFGMNATNMPFVNDEHGFWFIIAIMAVVSVVFFGFFKYKKWM